MFGSIIGYIEYRVVITLTKKKQAAELDGGWVGGYFFWSNLKLTGIIACLPVHFCGDQAIKH